MSLHECGEEEAQRFKWIESEKAGRDLGETAIRTWIGQHWNGFLRHRWLEHLQGKTFWIELDQGDFGLLRTAFQASPLIDPILEHFKHGRENLDIILWAIRHRLPMDEVLEILEALDVNSRRIECRFDPRRCRIVRIRLSRFGRAWRYPECASSGLRTRLIAWFSTSWTSVRTKQPVAPMSRVANSRNRPSSGRRCRGGSRASSRRTARGTWPP